MMIFITTKRGDSWFYTITLIIILTFYCCTFCRANDVNNKDDASNSNYQFAWDDQDSNDLYPNYIPVYNVRRDRKTNEMVSRGRFELLGRNPARVLNDRSKTVPLSKFKEVLQCATTEPTINGNRGIIDMLKMLPPTDKILLRVCNYLDTRCSWRECGRQQEQIRKGTPCREARKVNNMIRIINSTLFLDWAYCIYNPTTSFPYESMTIHLQHVLDMISDMKDSVFIVGAEQSTLPFNVPFPLISNSPSFHHSDIPWPWIESLKTEFPLYEAAREAKNFTEEFYRHPIVKQFLPWSHRISKAAYFGEMIFIRQIFFDQALIRPDLIEARWKCDFCTTTPWNPSSDENFEDIHKHNAEVNPKLFYHRNQTSSYTLDRSKIGYLDPLKYIRISEPTTLHMGHYKYLVVLTGIDARATSGRLATFLAYSGAVVLLQLSEFEYHFSARLKPWVHYVPLTYSAADIVSKIEWLQAHDDMAKQIAENGRNFALSYLRLEDQFCYVATALETFAEVTKNVVKPLYPTEIPYRFARRSLAEEYTD